MGRQSTSANADLGNARIHVRDGSMAVSDYWIQHAIDVIKSTYGVDVSVYQKSKDLLKFGENDLVGTSKATLMTLPAGVLHETYVSDNLITHISSNNAADAGRVIKLEGHTISGGDLTFVTQSVTLDGSDARTPVALTTPMARCTRSYTYDTTATVGIIYVFESDTTTAGVPDTASKVHLIQQAGKQNSSKAATSIASTDYWIVTSFTGMFLEKSAGYAEVHFETRTGNYVFLEKEHLSVNSSAPHSVIHFKPYIIIPANSDVRLVGTADGAGTSVGGSIQGVLAKVRV